MNILNREIWIDIKGFENSYMISSFGRVFSKNRNIIKKLVYDKDGYLRVNLWKDGKSYNYTVHRLVARHFIPNPENKTCVNHINSIRDDNNVDNLEWVTVKENNEHAFKYGKRKYSSIEHMRYMSDMKEKRLKPVEMYDLNYNLINIFKNSKEVSDETGIKRGSITDVCSGQRNTTHGYIFKYGKLGENK